MTKYKSISLDRHSERAGREQTLRQSAISGKSKLKKWWERQGNANVDGGYRESPIIECR